MCYICDAGAYTTDADSKAALDDLFVFDQENHSASLSEGTGEKVTDLSPYLYIES